MKLKSNKMPIYKFIQISKLRRYI